MSSPSSSFPEPLRRRFLERIGPLPEPSYLMTTDFLDLTPDECVASHILSHITRQKILFRLGRGFYCKPVRRPFGPLLPGWEEAFAAYAEHAGFRYAPIDATAAWHLGLIPEAPETAVFGSDAGYHRLTIQGHRIVLKPRLDPFFSYETTFAQLAVAAMRWIGIGKLSREQISILRGHYVALPPEERTAFRRDLQRMPLDSKRFFQKI